jgi:hypothetical protein
LKNKRTFGPHTARLVVCGKTGAVATFSRIAFELGNTTTAHGGNGARRLAADWQTAGTEQVPVNVTPSPVRLDGDVLNWNMLPDVMVQFDRPSKWPVQNGKASKMSTTQKPVQIPLLSPEELRRFNEAGRINAWEELSRVADYTCAQARGFRSPNGHNGH